MTTKRTHAQAGHAYAVGVGPGAPDLLTLRAIRIIESADLIIAPRSSRADDSLARQIIDEYLTTQDVHEQIYPMARDPEETHRCWAEMAQLAADRCLAGQAVVQITLGDPLVYSTSCYWLAAMRERLPADRVHVVPGITAMQSVASLFSEVLTRQEDRLTLMPATDLVAVEAALNTCETLVLYKCGRHLAALADLLERHGLSERACVACYAEQEGRELLSRDLRAVAAEAPGYLATAIISCGRRDWHEAPANDQVEVPR